MPQLLPVGCLASGVLPPQLRLPLPQRPAQCLQPLQCQPARRPSRGFCTVGNFQPNFQSNYFLDLVLCLESHCLAEQDGGVWVAHGTAEVHAKAESAGRVNCVAAGVNLNGLYKRHKSFHLYYCTRLIYPQIGETYACLTSLQCFSIICHLTTQ